MGAHPARADEPPVTLEEYARMPEEELHKVELVRGRLVREPGPGMEHAWIGGNLAGRLHRYLHKEKRGIVLLEASFVLAEDPPVVRIPDLSFVSDARIPEGAIPVGMARFAPDLAVEIVSPSNTAMEMQEKIADYLDAGARLVWVVYPRRREVAAYRSRDEIRVLRGTDALTGGDVLPGLEIPLPELFERS